MTAQGNNRLLKFFDEKGQVPAVPGSPITPSSREANLWDDHNGKLHWPGTPEGYPFRGEQAPMLKQHELEQITHTGDFHQQTFCMWNPADVTAYRNVQARCTAQWYTVTLRYDKWVEFEQKIAGPDNQEVTTKVPHLMIYLEWLQIYGEHPKGRRPRT